MKLLLYITLFFPSVIIGQITFFNAYGGEGNDYGKSIVTAIDTSYTIIGATESFGAGNTDMYLFNIDSLGDLKWSKTFGGSNVDWGMDLQQTRDTGYILCGYSNSYSWDYDILIVKTDKNGDSLWLKTYGGNDWDFANSIETTLDSGYIIAGETYSYGSGISDAYVIKLDSLGDTLWTKTFGGTGKDVFNDVIETFTGDFVFAGSTTTVDGDTDYWLVKTDNLGNEIWQYSAGDSLDEVINSVIQVIDSNFFFIGTKESITGTGLSMEFHKIRIDGTFWLTNNFDLVNDETGKYILQYAGDVDVVLGGSTSSIGNGGFDLVNMKITQSGFGTIFKTDGTFEDDVVEQADTTADNSIVIVGTTDGTTNGIKSVFVMKTDALLDGPNSIGEVFDVTSISSNPIKTSVNVYPSPASNHIYIKGVDIYLEKSFTIQDILGNVILKGTTSSNMININKLTSGVYFIQFPSLSKTPIKFTKI